MPPNVELPEQGHSQPDHSKQTAPKIGARAVVELLKYNLPPSLPAEFQLIEHRHSKTIDQLLKLLTQFQRQMANSPFANASVLTLITKHLVAKGQKLTIAKPDLGAIVLVDHIFDSLLNSEKFDKQAWCSLVRIRIPITKFALQDFSFFFAPQNNGRRLLNNMSLHLLGSAETHKNQVRGAIDEFVEKLNQQYEERVAEFNTICIETQAYFASQQRRLQKVETKISQIERKGVSLDRSEPLVVETLNQEVAGKELPELLLEFIYGEWRNSMQQLLRQEGEQSRNWKRQISLTQSMVKIHGACQSEEGREQYRRFWPSMIKGVRELLVSVVDDDEAFEQAIDPLELVCNALINGANPDLQTAPTLSSKSVVNDSFEVLPVAEKYLQEIETLAQGDWIRIRTPSNDYEACKLTIKANDNKPWVFVNNTGSKIAKKNKYVLAQGLRDGVVEIVGKGAWIDDLLRVSFSALATAIDKAKQAGKDKIQRQQRVKANKANKPNQSAPPGQEQQPVTPAEVPHRKHPQEPAISTQDQPLVREEAAPETAARKTTGSSTDKAAGSPEISLVSMEEQAKSYHVSNQPHQERTQEILTGSTLSIVSEETEKETLQASEGRESDSWENYYQEEELSDAELDAAKKVVAELEVGAIINRIVDGQPQRCKLAVRMKAKDKFIFVNPIGVKVWDTQEQAVIEAVARGMVTVIDSGVKFDRTLEQVVMNIQADKKGQDL